MLYYTTTNALPPTKVSASWLLGLGLQFPFSLKWISPILEGQGSALCSPPLKHSNNPFLVSGAKALPSDPWKEFSGTFSSAFLAHSSYWGRQLTSPPLNIFFLQLELARSFGWELETLGRECNFVSPVTALLGIFKVAKSKLGHTLWKKRTGNKVSKGMAK